jgi:hypothetical protein
MTEEGTGYSGGGRVGGRCTRQVGRLLLAREGTAWCAPREDDETNVVTQFGGVCVCVSAGSLETLVLLGR